MALCLDYGVPGTEPSAVHILGRPLPTELCSRYSVLVGPLRIDSHLLVRVRAGVQSGRFADGLRRVRCRLRISFFLTRERHSCIACHSLGSGLLSLALPAFNAFLDVSGVLEFHYHVS